MGSKSVVANMTKGNNRIMEDYSGTVASVSKDVYVNSLYILDDTKQEMISRITYERDC